jgi:hypothetical protein
MTARGVVSTHDLGVLSIHLDGAVCRVGCEFCYLGARVHESGAFDATAVEEALAKLRYREVAVAVSEPVETARPALSAIVRAARAPVAVTTTLQVAAGEPGLFDGIARVNLSVDPRKGRVVPARIAAVARALHAQTPRPDVVLIVSLISPEFAAQLVGGLLAELVDLPDVDKVALNALKPPPAWCDRAFWMRTLAALRPLLGRTLDTRLFLDCYVAARLLGLGGCPARPDLTPAAGGLAFRACVYQADADFVARSADELAARLDGFTPPARCPFPIQ